MVTGLAMFGMCMAMLGTPEAGERLPVRGRSGLPSTVGSPVASGCSSTTLGIGCGRVELVLAVAELGLAWLVLVDQLHGVGGDDPAVRGPGELRPL